MGEPKVDIAATPGAPSREGLSAGLLTDEDKLVAALIEAARFSPEQQAEIARLAEQLVKAARAGRRDSGGVDSFLHEYGLSSREGVLLLCLAEALLRIPDADNADRLIAGTIGGGDWGRHLGRSRVPSRQCLHLRADADRAGHRLGLRRRRRSRQHGAAPDRTKRRARHSPSASPGDAYSRRAVRARPDHRGGASKRRGRGRGGLSLLVRHAGRGCAHGR